MIKDFVINGYAVKGIIIRTVGESVLLKTVKVYGGSHREATGRTNNPCLIPKLNIIENDVIKVN